MIDLSLSLDGTNLLGFVALYIVIHFLVLQFETPWKKRSGYERILTIAALTLMVMAMAPMMPM